MKEHFLQTDVDRYELLNSNIQKYSSETNDYDIRVSYERVKLKLPIELFKLMLTTRSIDAKKYFPYVMTVKPLTYVERGNSYWLSESAHLGLSEFDTKQLTLYVDENMQHSSLSLCWILLHEFRHLMQYETRSLKTNVFNDNEGQWIKHCCASFDVDEKTVRHVFHEVNPAEIDANIFACETLDIEYPGSKFQITPYTLSLLNS